MKSNEFAAKIKQHKTAFSCACIAIAVIAIILAMVSCSASGEKADATTGFEASTPSHEDSISDMGGIEGEGLDSIAIDGTAEESGSIDAARKDEPAALEAPTAGSRGGDETKKSDPPATGKTPDDPSESPARRWVEDTERVWIVDRAAWTESKPIYETRERSICNICGADITGNTSAHNKAHMLAGEGSGYHNDVRQVQVGTETINHPEEGHWETNVVGGHWE